MMLTIVLIDKHKHDDDYDNVLICFCNIDMANQRINICLTISYVCAKLCIE